MLGVPNFLGRGGCSRKGGRLNWSESGVWVYFFNYNYEKALTMGVDGCRLRVMNMNAGWTNGKSGVSYALVLGSSPSPATNLGGVGQVVSPVDCKSTASALVGSIPLSPTIFAVAPVPRDARPIKWGGGTGAMPEGIKAPKIKGFVI